jgi:hypothetical protein
MEPEPHFSIDGQVINEGGLDERLQSSILTLPGEAEGREINVEDCVIISNCQALGVAERTVKGIVKNFKYKFNAHHGPGESYITQVIGVSVKEADKDDNTNVFILGHHAYAHELQTNFKNIIINPPGGCNPVASIGGARRRRRRTRRGRSHRRRRYSRRR